eukprot:scaffold68947_cov44-Attheya_sp.AAC.1
MKKLRQPNPLKSHEELWEAVKKYTKYNLVDAEEFATTHGWPIGRWDVSNIENFRCIFDNAESFNENIGSWDVSNARYMNYMFRNAVSFNQDISSWDTSNVQGFCCMFPL